MKFVCERCRTKYTIADEKVRQKVLKIRCRICSHVMVVRDPAARESTAASASQTMRAAALERALEGVLARSASTAPEPALLVAGAVLPGFDDEWHVSFDSAEQGPLGFHELADGVRGGRIPRHAQVWRDGFDSWQPITDVPELRPHFSRSGADPRGTAAAPGRSLGRVPSLPTVTGGAVPGMPPRPRAATPRAGVQPAGPARPSSSLRAVADSATPAAAVAPIPASIPAVMADADLPLPREDDAAGSGLRRAREPSARRPFLTVVPDGALAAEATPQLKRPGAERRITEEPLPPVLATPLAPAPTPPLAPQPALPPAPQSTLPLASQPAALAEVTGSRSQPRALTELDSDRHRVPTLPTAHGLALAASMRTRASTDEEQPQPLSGLATTSTVALATTPAVTPATASATTPTTTPQAGVPALLGLPSVAAVGGAASPLSGMPGHSTHEAPSEILVTEASRIFRIISTPVMTARAFATWRLIAIASSTVAMGMAAIVVYLVTVGRPQPPLPTGVAITTSQPLAPWQRDGGPVAEAVAAPATGGGGGAAVGPPPAAHAGGRPQHATKVVKTGDQQPPVLTGEQARLRELFASGDRPPAAGPPPVEPTPRAAPREVPQQTLLSVVRRNQGSPGLKLCYERALKRDLSLANARVDVSVTIGLSGAVKRVNILNDRYRGEYIGTCLAEVIRRWRFPAADSEYTTSFPLILQGS